MTQEDLTTNPQRPVVRIGDKVHRPADFWTPAVHSLLEHLASVGFDYAPRVFGFDDQGREVLQYFEGESGGHSWKKVVSDEGLQKYAKLLRGYHDAVKSYKPPEELEWGNGAKGLKPGEIICHGDFGVWNIVWQGDDPVGIVDWDCAYPAKPEFDILYALEYSAPFRDDTAALKWHGFSQPPDRKHRIKVFMDAYGTPMIQDVAYKVARMQRQVGEYEAYLAQRGVQPQANWVANGDLEEVEKHAEWSETHASLFE
jgi:Ser/Thr protein kinase RdoA (MazF antagonist)